MRDFMCDLSERALFFRCMVVRLCWHFCNFPWLAKCFCTSFCILEAVSQLGGHVLQPKGKEKQFCRPWKNRNILATHFEAWKSFCSHFEGWKIILQSKWEFCSPFLKLGAFSYLKKFSHLGKDFSHFGFQSAKFLHLCAVCLQMDITSSF